jgi:Flp pilus assembly protein TadD
LITQARGILVQRDVIATEAAREQVAPPTTLKAAFEHSSILAAGGEAANELAVLQELSAAAQARTDSGGAARALGLLGADPQADLDSARNAFSSGDLGKSMSLATGARLAWQGANGAGQRRIFGSLCVLSGGLMLLGLFMWGRGNASRAQLARAGVVDDGATSPAGTAIPADGETRGTRPKARARTIAAERPTSDGPAFANGAATAEGAAIAGAAIARPGANPMRVGRSRKPVGSLPAAMTNSLDPSSKDQDCLRDAGHDVQSGQNGDGASVSDDGSIGSEESAYDLLQRGHALIRDRHNAQAAVVLERAARLEQGKGSILEALGRAYFNSGQHARAAETFEALLEIDPSAHYGHFALGLSFARLGRLADAKTHLRLAVALDPASDTYRRALEKMEATEP